MEFRSFLHFCVLKLVFHLSDQFFDLTEFLTGVGLVNGLSFLPVIYCCCDDYFSLGLFRGTIKDELFLSFVPCIRLKRVLFCICQLSFHS